MTYVGERVAQMTSPDDSSQTEEVSRMLARPSPCRPDQGQVWFSDNDNNDNDNDNICIYV